MMDWLKNNWVIIVVLVGLAVGAILLCGCKTSPGELNTMMNNLMGTAGTAKAQVVKIDGLAEKGLTEAKAIDKEAPPALKPKTAAHVGTMEVLTGETGAAVGTVRDLEKLAGDAQKQTESIITQLANAKAISWFTWFMRVFPVVLCLAVALTLLLLPDKLLPALLVGMKPVLIPGLIGAGVLGAIYLVVSMIPAWMFWTTGILIILGGAGFAIWKLVRYIRGMSMAIQSQPNAVEIALEAKAEGARGASGLLESMDTLVEPPKA